MKITKEFISSVSLNDTVFKNGADLAKKKNFKNLAVDKDKTYISGECFGSGKNPYICSVDFILEDSPVFRCSCPSRQIPCKHVVGLLWAYMEGHSFFITTIPEEILAKRENKQERVKKAKEKLESAEKDDSAKEKSSAWIKSAVKKIEAQLAGIEEAKKILFDFAQSGFGSVDSKIIANYVGIVKQLDSYFIPGIQSEITDLFAIAGSCISEKDKSDNLWHMAAAEKLCRIYTLLEKSREYLENKKSAPDKPDIKSEIEELIGYAWKLEELSQYGLFETDAKLLQLCFHVRQEDDKKQFVEEGYYVSLNSGNIYKTLNYRPYKAVKYIKEEDSVFDVLNIPKLYIYPGSSINPRVRWDEFSFEAVTSDICRSVLAFAKRDYQEVIKSVKNQLKNLFLLPHPAVLLNFEKIIKADGGDYVIYSGGNSIRLKKSGYFIHSFAFLLDSQLDSAPKKRAVLAVFDNDIKSGELFAQPVALVTDEKIARLVY
ncbi:MAG: SWIM zinc finger family protein [Oscillospiraceae bacterium]|nr:SWIM zinc finger family protein [Oscillospiraceae bacterium]